MSHLSLQIQLFSSLVHTELSCIIIDCVPLIRSNAFNTFY